MASFLDIVLATAPVAGQAAAGFAAGQLERDERRRREREREIERARQDLLLEQIRLANEKTRRDLARPGGPRVTVQRPTDQGTFIVTGDPSEIGSVLETLPPAQTPGEQGVNWQTVTDAEGNLIQVNPRTGETRPLGVRARVPGSGKSGGTVAQQEARILLARAETGLATIERIIAERGGRPPALTNRLDDIPLVGRFFLNEEQQLFETAAVQVISALLRKESGAVINESEIRDMARALVPQAGDRPATVELKLRALRASVEALRQAAATGDESAVREARELLEETSGVRITGGRASTPPDRPRNPFR